MSCKLQRLEALRPPLYTLSAAGGAHNQCDHKAVQGGFVHLVSRAGLQGARACLSGCGARRLSQLPVPAERGAECWPSGQITEADRSPGEAGAEVAKQQCRPRPPADAADHGQCYCPDRPQHFTAVSAPGKLSAGEAMPDTRQQSS